MQTRKTIRVKWEKKKKTLKRGKNVQETTYALTQYETGEADI